MAVGAMAVLIFVFVTLGEWRSPVFNAVGVAACVAGILAIVRSTWRRRNQARQRQARFDEWPATGVIEISQYEVRAAIEVAPFEPDFGLTFFFEVGGGRVLAVNGQDFDEQIEAVSMAEKVTIPAPSVYRPQQCACPRPGGTPPIHRTSRVTRGSRLPSLVLRPLAKRPAHGTAVAPGGEGTEGAG